jgi:DNA topoisomerase-1
MDPDRGREAAREARLTYSTDARPGIRRVRSGRGFRYVSADGKPVRDTETLSRIRSLAIPPAWTDVWICSSPNGHLQATGRDARGRKVYRYHAGYRQRREQAKYERMAAFAKALPRIRRRVARDLRRPGLTRERVLATVVQLLERTRIRVGNDEYSRTNRSYGLTTLRDRHASIDGTQIRFRFTGKGGRDHEVDVRDRRLAGIVRRCRDLPGQDLFQYLDEDGEPRAIRSDDVNAYLREAAGGADITAKDFRTWAGTVMAYRALRALEPGASEREVRRNVVAAMRSTADGLGNTAAVARASYVHPAVVDAYLEGQIAPATPAKEDRADVPDRAEELEVARLLREAAEAPG